MDFHAGLAHSFNCGARSILLEGAVSFAYKGLPRRSRCQVRFTARTAHVWAVSDIDPSLDIGSVERMNSRRAARWRPVQRHRITGSWNLTAQKRRPIVFEIAKVSRCRR
jgi:hypothetical protein